MTLSMKAVHVLGTVLTLSVASVGCGGGDEKLTQLPASEKGAGASEAVQVSVVPVTRQEVVRSVVATGTTEPARAANIGPQLTGRVSAVLVDEGDKVDAGAVLVRLDADEASLRVQQANAGAAQARAQYLLAKAEYDRLAPLVAKGTVTPQQLQRLEAQRDALKSAADAAMVGQSDAQRMAGNTTVRAPFAGIVSKVSIEIGEVATMVPPTTLLRLVDISHLDVRVRVHERLLPRVSVGDAIDAKFPSSNATTEGVVTFISPEIDPRTRNAEVVTRIPNPDAQLRAGMFAEIRIKPRSSPNSLVVPATAIAGTGDERYVFTVEGGHIKRQRVKVSSLDDKLVEVLEGLTEGQMIVREGLGRLSEGALVTVSGNPEFNARPPLVPPKGTAPSTATRDGADTQRGEATP